MAVAGVEVRAERVEVEIHVPRRMRSVDDRHEPFGPGARDDLLHGQEQPRFGGDVRDVDDPSTRGESREEPLDDVAVERKRYLGPDVVRAGASADIAPRVVARSVLEVGRQHLLSGLEIERLGGEIDAGRRVLDECEVVRPRPQVGAELGARTREQLR